MFISFSQIIRTSGDIFLVASRSILLAKIFKTQSVSGLSLQTQLIYLVAYICRYLDLVTGEKDTRNIALYLKVMKVIFLAYQVAMIYLICVKFKNTYNKRYDNFNVSVLFLVSAALSFFVKGASEGILEYVEEYAYTVSLILESVAILPQLVMLQEAGDCETMTSHYIFLLGIYRLIYVLYFVHRWINGYRVLLMLITGIIQTGLYIDFFLVYYRQIIQKVKFKIGNADKPSVKYNASSDAKNS